MAANSIVNLPAFAEPGALSTSTTFQINCTKLYEHLRQGLKRTIPWNKYINIGLKKQYNQKSAI